MKWWLIIALVCITAGCSTYKELKPNPLPVSQEQGYINILNKDKPFEVKKGKKYKMSFPDVAADDYYLVFQIENMQAVNTFLTRQFDDKGGMKPIEDSSGPLDKYTAYKMDHSVPTYFWIIEDVFEDAVLDVDYRYVPIWRFRFEVQHDEFKTVLSRNSVYKQSVRNLGTTTRATDVNWDTEVSDLASKTASLKKVQSSLGEIEKILPQRVINSSDPAYRDYVALKDELAAELEYQDDYTALAKAFLAEKNSRGNDGIFAASLPAILDAFARKNRLPASAIDELKSVTGARLGTLGSYMDQQVRNKQDSSPIKLPAAEVLSLIRETGQSPDADLASVTSFITSFNQIATSVADAKSEMAAIDQEIVANGQWPANGFYAGLGRRLNGLLSSLPASTGGFGKYGTYRCVAALNRDVAQVRADLIARERNYRRADNLVSQINQYRGSGNIAAISELLKGNSDLGFLVDQYPDLDEMSIQEQESEIRAALNDGNWPLAERRIRGLYEDRNFINYEKIAAKKRDVVRASEERLVSAIEAGSRSRINRFIDENLLTIDNVEALYDNPAFSPVHTLTFSADGNSAVQRYNARVTEYLDGLKHDAFPRRAIESLYKEFTRDTRDRGVDKAKAVIIHGKYYSGNDKNIKNLIAECNPSIAKWITKAKTYRNIYVVPVNDRQQASNEYMFRINLQIPSDANFPVFDVNMKLPRELAAAAGDTQWFTSMSLNGEPVKNEGRFTITAPTKDNDYECQVTPLQVKKEGNNILEVRFNHSAFKVLEVSIMAQRPIIRRN